MRSRALVTCVLQSVRDAFNLQGRKHFLANKDYREHQCLGNEYARLSFIHSFSAHELDRDELRQVLSAHVLMGGLHCTEWTVSNGLVYSSFMRVQKHRNHQRSGVVKRLIAITRDSKA